MNRNRIMLAGSTTQVGMIRDLYLARKTEREAVTALRPLVESQTPPMVFSANVENPVPGGPKRERKPIWEQLVMLEQHVSRIYNAMQRGEISPSPVPETPIVTPPEPFVFDGGRGVPEIEVQPEPEDERETPKPQAGSKVRAVSELDKFVARAREIRVECDRREKDDRYIDKISIRPFNAAGNLIPVGGLSADTCLATMTIDWPDGAKRDFNIPQVDFKQVSRDIAKTLDLPTTIVRKDTGRTEKLHEMFGLAFVYAQCRQPIYLCGPAGTGKSHLVKQLADFMDLPYGEAAMSSGATRGDLLGRNTIAGVDQAIALSALLGRSDLDELFPDDPNLKMTLANQLLAITKGEGGGYVSSEYQDRFCNGGFFNFDEIDSADASMLILINNAMESDQMFNTTSGKTVDKHLDYIAAATANTWGSGANRVFKGRKALDFATLDRFRMGRIWVDIDPAIEELLAYRNVKR